MEPLTHVLDLIQCLLLANLEASGLLGESVMVVLGSHGDFCVVVGMGKKYGFVDVVKSGTTRGR